MVDFLFQTESIFGFPFPVFLAPITFWNSSLSKEPLPSRSYIEKAISKCLGCAKSLYKN